MKKEMSTLLAIAGIALVAWALTKRQAPGQAASAGLGGGVTSGGGNTALGLQGASTESPVTTGSPSAVLNTSSNSSPTLTASIMPGGQSLPSDPASRLIAAPSEGRTVSAFHPLDFLN